MKITRLAIPLSALCLGFGAASAQVVDHVPVDQAGPLFVPPGLGAESGRFGSGAEGSGAGARTGAAGGVDGALVALSEDDAASAGAAAVQALEDATRFCAAVPSEYAVDCLAERLQAVARSMPATGPLAESRQVLNDTAIRLAAVARSNADPAKPRQNFAAPSLPRPVATTRPLTPVAPAAQDEVNAAAVAILDQAETLLLRSSATAVAAPAAPEIERIAAAVGSNKVLLRSA